MSEGSRRHKGGGITRREFLRNSALAGCTALVASQLEFIHGLIALVEAQELTEMEAYELMRSDRTLFTACLNCNTGCGLKVKMIDGVIVKIDGNPYNPFALHPHLPMSMSPYKTSKTDGAICPKGQSAHQGAYDPYRIRKVLKRAGRRGEGKWISIPFDQAVTEIVNGGVIFSHVPGEEKRQITGLKELHAMHDPATFAAMAGDVEMICKKRMTVAEFKARHAENLHLLIDPDHPDFGPKNNQFVYFWGRIKGGRSDFARRFTDAFGTINTHGHTTVCQGSLYFACKAMSEQYAGNGFRGGQKFYWQADQEHAEYILFVGANLFDANYGPPNRTPRMTERLVTGKLKMTVIDPRFTKLAAKAQRWVPIRPGTDAAFAMGMTRWILENRRFDATYLANANRAGATKDQEPTWSNATWLVKIDDNGEPGAFLRASEIGLRPKEVRKDKEGRSFEFEFLVAIRDGEPVAFDPNDTRLRVRGELFVDTVLKGEHGPVRVKSSLQLMLEASRERTLAEYAAVCGIEPGIIEAVAREFTSHGKKACVEVHRGAAQHTNGFYAVSALMNLNLLMGNFDWKGGMIAPATFNYDGSSNDRQPYNLKKMSPKTGKPFGLSVIRHGTAYEDSTIFAGYPARRNWWPLSSDIYQEILPSIADAYPYPIKALFSYMGSPSYALPAGDAGIAALTDLERVPLYFASDITIGSTSMYADYVFPDLHFLERWEFQGSHPNMPVKVQPVRHPVIVSPNEVVKVFGEDQPISFETLWLALAEKLELPGFGKDGFATGLDLKTPEQFYWRMVANLAYDGSVPVADAGSEEVGLFYESHRHLPTSVLRIDQTGDLDTVQLSKAIHILNRGGRFDTQESAYDGDYAANRYGRLINLYQEKTALVKDAFTGRHFHGLPGYQPVADTLDRAPVAISKGHDLHLITQKDIRMTKSRTVSNQYLTGLFPENAIMVNAADGKRLGLKQGQKVKVVSATNPSGEWVLGNGVKKPIIGRVQLTETIRPGVITFTHGHGLWASGATDMVIDGIFIKGDPRRAGGVNANAAMWLDPHLKNTCMIDKVGGSVSFYDTKVRLVMV
ncbi:bis-(molybdopterin guanine dinucleotide)-oxomolybdenum-binding oxidoreductase, putative [Geotalea daltonii FRC-32]|uniref:Bis-(Molybdopterin guanine dinucleotide)-oxomolybdenum-binding oxidoreductase, putative n=1 Tax=Geotalea daltonii (strain DSM 22248 / JCM 15807 / FRC-32) TaxID=316067 RepID=B9M4J1_GEODF|nr:molybdopterin-dependent oxidoreductase [Geotalea daltonii]ACM19717.1 bis-(molybdopterin guanine dinucleotide)-oxomolybdenum-binding oxidoreductase, putative [Geotalea daltonii FRC-32]